MKVVILAGGLGTRLSEETIVKPKPMVEIGGKPILWHIMNIYAAYGFKEFVLALGYKGEIIKDYFFNFHSRVRNMTVQLKNGQVTFHDGESEDWVVHLLDTGLETQTGGRIKRAAQFIGAETFLCTYGDGVSNVNIARLVDFHRKQKKLMTLTAVRPSARFGQVVFAGDRIIRFEEKPQIGEGWVNGGFFVIEPQAIEYIEGDNIVFEREPLEKLSGAGELVAYKHDSFWQCMDTLRDVHLLEKFWQAGNAPWKIW